jgi:photosystem II stability/assembly factor-like uncharacterized protein
MKKFILIIVLLLSLANTSSSQWIKQNWPVFESIYGISFFDNNIGLVAGKTFPASQFVIYRTTNGGFNWSESYNFVVYGMQKIDSNTAYCWGRNSATSYGFILRTFDRGSTWDSINYGLNSLCDIYFLTKDTGWVTIFDGNAARPYKTTDGGITLTFLNSTGSYQTTSFFMKEKYNGNYLGYRSNYHAIKKTIDGGYNWIDLPELPIVPQYDKNGKLLTPQDVIHITFVNKDTGWVSNGSKSIFKTTNGGMNWIPQTIPSDSHLIFTGLCNFIAINKDTLFSDIGTYDFGNGIYRGVVFKTTNGGTNWGYQLPDTSYRLFNFSKLSFINGNTGWSSNIHTNNGGGPIIFTEIKNIVVEHPERSQLKQNYPNPFNPSTTIDFYLPHKSVVELKIFDITGKTVLRIIDNFHLQQGYHSYKIDDFNSLGLSSSTYFYRLTAFDNSKDAMYTETKRMIYLK